MKTKSLTIAILLIIATLSTNTLFASEKAKTGTVLTEAKNFNKIEVRGNVEVYLSNGEENSVKVNSNYYGESALVQNQNGTLRISSYTKDALVVYVTAAELSSIAVYDNSFVKTAKNFSSLELNVNLYNNAAAQLDLNAINANIIVNDRAKANISGTVADCDMQINQASTVNSTNFMAEHINKKINGAQPAGTAKNESELTVI